MRKRPAFRGFRRRSLIGKEDAGSPKLEVSAWVALFAPKETPKHLDKLTDTLDRALDDDIPRKRVHDQ